MASTQHPVRGVGPDPKGDSLVAIKEWLIRDPRSAQPESCSDFSYSAASDRSPNQDELDGVRRISEVFASDCTVDQKELDDAPSIVEASEPLIDVILDERANAAATIESVGCRVMQGDEVQEAKSAVRKLLLRATACAVVLAVVAVCTFEILPYVEQSGIFSNQDPGKDSQRSRNAPQSVRPSATSGDAQSASASDRFLSPTLRHRLEAVSEDLRQLQGGANNAWNRFRNWSSDELHAVLPKQDLRAGAEHSETAAQSVQPAATIDRPSSPGFQHQLDKVGENLGFVQHAASNAWSRLRDWSSHQLQAVLPGKGTGAVPDSSAAAAHGVTLSTISNDIASPIQAQPAPPADRPLSSELQHQLDTMTANLGILQRIVAELTDRQEQITKDIATLQTAQQNVSQKLSALPRSLVAGTPRKSLRHRAY